jgi:hypothetical protein
MRTVWGIFLQSNSQSAPKQGIKIFLRHFPTTLVPSLALQISQFVQSSFESPKPEIFSYHLPYSRSRRLVKRQRRVKLCKVSDGTRVVGKCLRNFFIPCFGPGYVWELRNIPQTVRKKYTTFNTERMVALRSVNKISRRATISLLMPPYR